VRSSLPTKFDFDDLTFYRPKGAINGPPGLDKVWSVVVSRQQINLRQLYPEPLNNDLWNIGRKSDAKINWTDFLFENYWDAYAYFLMLVKKYNGSTPTED